MAAHNLRPRRQRPRLRAMLVEAQVSSMNTSFVGSRSSCPANQAWRCVRTSERRCSSACAVFFKSHLVAIEEAPDHGGGEALAAIGDQSLLDSQERNVRLTANETKQIIAMGFDAMGTAIPANRARGNPARGLEARHPAHRAGDAHPETLGRRIARHAGVHHCPHNALAKILGKRHPRRLLRAAKTMNQNNADSRIPSDSLRSDTALRVSLSSNRLTTSFWRGPTSKPAR